MSSLEGNASLIDASFAFELTVFRSQTLLVFTLARSQLERGTKQEQNGAN